MIGNDGHKREGHLNIRAISRQFSIGAGHDNGED
jgi:hypothetical protein